MEASFYAPASCPRLVVAVMDALGAASASYLNEVMAACKIQSTYRMWRERRAYCRLCSAALCIQRVYRGHWDRRRVEMMRQDIATLHERCVYEYYASLIQACFRGYYVRRYKDNFYARRHYIQLTVRASEAVRGAAALELEEQQTREDAEKVNMRLKDYRGATEKIHFMTSTMSLDSIYRRPMDTYSVPTIYGTYVEDDIRRNSSLVRRPELEMTVRTRLKMAAKKAKEASGEWGRRPHDTTMEHTPDKGESADDSGKMMFTVTSGAWNRCGVKGCSLPSINGVGKGYAVRCNVSSHCCTENFLSTNDEESKKIALLVDKKEIELLHKKQRFITRASRNV
uniref:Uncharacterized protein TCIL3000_11_10850 n=1 Tax=Trypanosoma congolense (strain IL3000) TaxID=1068625 RepID=G0V1T7_TRYCI|nr:unnamed protein product [Trypanosoma congolense IL3000]